MLNDPILKKLITQYPPPQWNDRTDYLFEDLVDTIISQQLSSKAAENIFQRFKQLFIPLQEFPLPGERTKEKGKITTEKRKLHEPLILSETSFPSPEQILSMKQGSISAIGVSNSKEAYIRNVAQAFIDKEIEVEK